MPQNKNKNSRRTPHSWICNRRIVPKRRARQKTKELEKTSDVIDKLDAHYGSYILKRVVYKLSCSGCTSTYVGQTIRFLTTRIEEHKKADSPVGLHLPQCQLEENSAGLSWDFLDKSNNQTKLFALEAIHIRKRNRA